MGAGRLIMELERAGKKKKAFPEESDVCREASGLFRSCAIRIDIPVNAYFSWCWHTV